MGNLVQPKLVQKAELSEADAQKFQQYYGTHPKNCEGAGYFRNSEQQVCFKEVTGKAEDLAVNQPIKSNIPYINVLVNERFKVRAFVDSGATTTLISTGLLNMMTGITVHPSSFTFFGVGPDAMKFAGVAYGVSLRLCDSLSVQENIGVFEHPKPTLIIGNETIGGVNAKLGIVAHNAF